MGKLADFYLTKEQLEDAKACSFSIFDNELLKDVIMKDNIVDKWCEVNLNTEQMIEVGKKLSIGITPFNFPYEQVFVLNPNVNNKEEPRKCHCPDINFSFQGLGCVCGGI